MKSLTLLCALLFCGAFVAGRARACDCAPPANVAEGVQQVDVVFQGTASQVEQVKYSPGWTLIKATFDVVRVWKGPIASEIVVYTDLDEGNCGFGFVELENYIVYAERKLARGSDELITHICSRTRISTDDEILALGASREVRDFLRGDVDGDVGIQIGDAIGILNYLFLSGDLACLKSADTNDSGTLNIADPIYLLNHLFLGGAPPPAPFGQCGLDPTPDELPCESVEGCG